MSESYDFFISAGEPSGDVLGGELVKSLRQRSKGLKGFGIIGPNLKEQGIHGIADIADLSVMGFIEVFKQIGSIKSLEIKIVEHVRRYKPKVAILIDYPGFHMRLAPTLRSMGVFVFQFVAPQLWAWGQWRIKKLRKAYDEILGIMPFEKEFFESRGVNYSYVGTPQVDRARKAKNRKEDFLITSDHRSIGFFPGSRNTEVTKLLVHYKKIIALLKNEFQISVSIAPSVKLEKFSCLVSEKGFQELCNQLEDKDVVQIEGLTFIRGSSLDHMNSVDAALVASGTATLECALCNTPLGVMYEMNPTTYKLAKVLVKVDWISLVNLVSYKEIVKEFIQVINENEVADYLRDICVGNSRDQVLENIHELKSKLKSSPAENAAIRVLEQLQI